MLNKDLIANGKTKTSFNRLDNTQCGSVKQSIQSDNPIDTSACGRIKIPENPMRNFTYSVLNYLNNRKAAEELLTEWITDSGQTVTTQDPVTFQKMVQEITFYMYNGGTGGIKDIFELLTTENVFPMPLEGENGFKRTLSRYLGNCYGGQPAGLDCNSNTKPPTKTRKEEVSTYTDNIRKNLSAIEKNAGDIKCSI